MREAWLSPSPVERTGLPTFKFTSSLRVKSTLHLWELTALSSERLRSLGKAELWSRRRWGCGVFSSAWWQVPKVRVSGVRHRSMVLVVTTGDWQGLVLFVHRCPVPGAAAGIRTQTGEALPDPLPHLCCLWILHHNQCIWLELDPPAPRKGARVDGMHTFCCWHSI